MHSGCAFTWCPGLVDLLEPRLTIQLAKHRKLTSGGAKLVPFGHMASSGLWGSPSQALEVIGGLVFATPLTSGNCEGFFDPPKAQTMNSAE